MHAIKHVLIRTDLLIMDVETALARGWDPRIPAAKAKVAHKGIEYVLAWLDLLEAEKKEPCKLDK